MLQALTRSVGPHLRSATALRRQVSFTRTLQYSARGLSTRTTSGRNSDNSSKPQQMSLTSPDKSTKVAEHVHIWESNELRKVFMVTIFDQDGTIKQEKMTKQEIQGMVHGMKNRDFYILQDGGAESAGFLVREGFSLIRLAHVKCFVMRDRVMLLDSDQAGLSHLIDSLASLSDLKRRTTMDGDEIPYELVVLEATLQEVTSILAKRVRIMTAVVDRVLYSLKGDMHDMSFQRLLPIKSNLGSLVQSVVDGRDVIKAVAADDNGMRKLALLTVDAGIADTPWDDEVELILDAYADQLDDVINQAAQLRSRIDDHERLLEIRIDTVRNRMLRLNLHMSMATLAGAFGSMFAGLFGMNLMSGLEEVPHLFFTTTGCILLGSSGIYYMLYDYYNKPQGAEAQQVDDWITVNKLLTGLDVVESLLDRFNAKGHNEVSKEDFSTEFIRILRQHCETGPFSHLITDEQHLERLVELVYDTLDDNNDGSISLDELGAGLSRSLGGRRNFMY